MVKSNRRAWTLVATMALVAVTLVGCGDDDDDAAGTTTVPTDDAGAIQIDETEYAYAVSGTAPEGWVTLDIANTGDEYHMMAVGRMRDGVTLDQVRETLGQAFGGGEPEPPAEDGDAAGTLGEVELVSAQESTTTTTTSEGPDTTEDTTDVTTGGQEDEGGEGEGEDPFALLFQEELGAPGHIMAPGESFTITTELDPGDYAVMCFLPTPDGESDHISEGMINSFTVEESDEPAPMPEAGTEITIADESAEVPEELSSGEITEVHMTGSEHELMYVRLLDEDATIEDVDAHFARFDTEPLPMRDELETGAPAIIDVFIFSREGDQHFFITRELDAGEYYIGCGLDEGDEGDTGEGRDHAETEIARVTVT